MFQKVLYREDFESRNHQIVWKQTEDEKRVNKLLSFKSSRSLRLSEKLKKELMPAKFTKVLLVEDNSHSIHAFVEMMQKLEV